ncbi:MAG: ROK family protein [Candidatus Omnitrophica bacterium]|nr:ROK family protein [Candidatus Omnitrophota bacterium]
MNLWGGVDFGGTNIKLGLVTRQGRVISQTTLLTRQHPDPDTFVQGVASTLRSLARTQRAHLLAVGVGAPGLIDAERGRIHQLVNVPGGWRGIPLARLMEQTLGCPCAVDNDVNVVALGEWSFGAGRGTKHSVYVTLGTGVGGALVINGRLVRGMIGSAGEIGHTSIALTGPRCACGRRGCLEAFVSTQAILRRARRAIREGASVLRRLVAREGRLTPEVVARAAAAGDRLACQIWREVGVSLGRGIANVINLLNPERIIIGGGVANAWRFFAPSLHATLSVYAFEAPLRAVRVVRAQLNDRAGIIGGACLAWERE